MSFSWWTSPFDQKNDGERRRNQASCSPSGQRRLAQDQRSRVRDDKTMLFVFCDAYLNHRESILSRAGAIEQRKKKREKREETCEIFWREGGEQDRASERVFSPFSSLFFFFFPIPSSSSCAILLKAREQTEGGALAPAL